MGAKRFTSATLTAIFLRASSDGVHRMMVKTSRIDHENGRGRGASQFLC
jgi:hypothetical protein